jgi:hypothetical protein
MALDRLSDVSGVFDCVDALLPGTWLFHDQYRITRFLNAGGFGITYLAKDRLNRDVVLKECFVGAFCCRSQTRVRPRSEAGKAQLDKVMRGFLNEAHTLAALSHPNIVRIHQVFEDNDTAYMALDYIKGHDLQEIVDDRKARLSPELIVAITRKLVSALDHIHRLRLLHCDVSPDNICLTEAGEPVLIDFGAARKSAVGGATQYTGFSLVKDGYSPYELYSTGGTSGPWSDIYALGATVYHAISGAAPADCQNRLSALVERRPDPVRPLSGRFAGYPAGFLESIDRAMSVKPAARFQSAEDWVHAMTPPKSTNDRSIVLVRRATAPVASVVPVAPVAPVRPQRPVRPH